jgi:hypothetical protein
MDRRIFMKDKNKLRQLIAFNLCLFGGLTIYFIGSDISFSPIEAWLKTHVWVLVLIGLAVLWIIAIVDHERRDLENTPDATLEPDSYLGLGIDIESQFYGINSDQHD